MEDKEFSIVTRVDGRLSNYGQYDELTEEEAVDLFIAMSPSTKEVDVREIVGRLQVGGSYYIDRGQYATRELIRRK